VNPSELEAGSVKALPRSLAEAVAALEADSVLRKGLGEPLVKAVLAVRKVSVRTLDC
jgi:glutamine synthetase